MSRFAVLGQVVLKDRIISDGAVVVEGGVIQSVGRRADIPLPSDTADYGDRYIAPGFVDIHCHAGGGVWAYENPRRMAEYHRMYGTTTLLCTLYRDLSYSDTQAAIENIKNAMKTSGNIAGVHMEGPYLNPKYGSGIGEDLVPDPNEYLEIAKSGVVRQWTFAPEISGTDEFLKDIVSYGIIPAIGHSNASPEKIRKAAQNGTRIVTHLFNASGSSIFPSRYEGTLEVSFDSAALLCDNLYYELICDENGVHVRPDMVRLTAKTVGVDRIVGITDACAGAETGSDMNIVNGELMGSKLTMLKVARNFYGIGFTVPEVMRITSYNPACAIGMDKTVGSIEKGKRADLIAIDKTFADVLQVKEIGG